MDVFVGKLIKAKHFLFFAVITLRVYLFYPSFPLRLWIFFVMKYIQSQVPIKILTVFHYIMHLLHLLSVETEYLSLILN